MTSHRALSVMQVSRSTRGGGAERIAVSLHHGLTAAGHSSWLATLDAADDPDPRVIQIPTPTHSGVGPWAQRLLARAIGSAGPVSATAAKAAQRLRSYGTPAAIADELRGRENYDFPGTALLAELSPEPNDVLHLHNLHGHYFDLRQLGSISAAVPTAITLHDEWMFTGHCGYSLDCERWRVGCGECPYLHTYPAVRRDSTARNLGVKSEIYRTSRLHICAPSAWLLDRARASSLDEAAASWRVIPNGVDQSVFRPGDRAEARHKLGLPDDDFVVLFVANRARSNEYKDFPLIERAVMGAGTERPRRGLRLVVVGEDGPAVRFDGGSIKFVAYDRDPSVVADFYRAADAFVHAARSDNYPTTILEAMSSGLPVVATATGGIPEQVVDVGSGTGDPTGLLVGGGDSSGMRRALVRLIDDPDLRARLGDNALHVARDRYSLRSQVEATVDWYREIVSESTPVR